MTVENRKFFTKAFVLVASVLALQVVLNKTFDLYGKTVAKADWAESLLQFRNVLIFGDSTINYISNSEGPELSLMSLVSTSLPELSFNNQGHSGHHLEIWNDALDYMTKHKAAFPDLIVIPINLGSFGVEWTLKPGFQRDLERAYLRHHGKWWFESFYKFLYTFEFLKAQSVSDHEYNQAYKASAVSLYPGIKGEMIERYLAALSADTPRVQALKQLSGLLRARGQKALFYLTPIDYEVGLQHVGADFKQRLDLNIKLLSEILASNGYTLENHVYDLPKSNFDAFGKYSEHLLLNGRKTLAQKLTVSIRSHLNAKNQTL